MFKKSTAIEAYTVRKSLAQVPHYLNLSIATNRRVENMYQSRSILHLSSLFFSLIIIRAVIVSASDTNLPQERYELCQNQTQIDMLQKTYGLIQVSAIPTKAAMHPEWPETVINIIFFAVTLFLWIVNYGINEEFGFSALILPFIEGSFWTVSFAFIEHEKDTGGWLSLTDGAIPAILWLWATEAKSEGIRLFVSLFWGFQTTAELALLIQRWKGTVGSIAYQIIDANGCTPHNNGFNYLQQGARSRIFKIIQTVEYCYAGIVIGAVLLLGMDALSDRQMSSKLRGLKVAAGAGLFLIWIPVLMYEVRIAVLGTPVVISGNCMLVELNPKWGFLDSEIETYWKVFASLAGM